MSDIRHWAAGALAVVTLAVGTGAGVVLTSAQTPLPPPVAAVAAPATAPETVAPSVTPTPAAGPAEAPTTTAPPTTTRRTTTTTTSRRRTAAECARIADASSLSTARLRSYLRSIGCGAARGAGG
jgi:hypothetical protein